MEDFNKLVKKDRFQVFLFTCSASMPLSFARHYWFVCVKKGQISRWEVLFRKNRCKTSWGHLHLNFLTPFKGIEIIPFYEKFFWKARLAGYIDGKADSIAKKMVNFIENSNKNYPYCYKYSLTGPNSNTYIQWVISHFSEFKLTLSWNSFGKHYKIKKNK